MKADLHIHTCASDGCFTVQEIGAMATEVGLEMLAITDHDTMRGFLQIQQEQVHYPFVLVPGVEFSTEVGARDVHILGYNFMVNDDHFNTVLDDLAHDRMSRVQMMVRRLHTMGYAIDFERVVELSAGSVSVGRPHIARALLERGYVSSRREAFDCMLNKNSPAYVPHKKMLPQQVIDLIHQAQGIAVLAHPALIGDDVLVGAMMAFGIDGLEVFHPKHSQQDTMRYLSMAEAHGLMISGGSDFHGSEGRYPVRLGDFLIPDHYADQLTFRRHEKQ